MRAILFRGRRLDNGEWVEGYYMRYGWTGEVKDRIMMDGASALYAHEVDPATVGQYTGLTDKHGRKIFKGDVVGHCHPSVWHSEKQHLVCEWEERYFEGQLTKCGVCFRRIGSGMTTRYTPNIDFEVIGNIHDNPELLEATPCTDL